jgi:hypothetical protein
MNNIYDKKIYTRVKVERNVIDRNNKTMSIGCFIITVDSRFYEVCSCEMIDLVE